jgi:hypothetical protein
VKLVPTNKRWLEHTEQAAWQSVDALREKLALAEQRQQRLAPPVEGWRELCDALDAAKAEHGLGGESYAAMIRALVAGVTAADERVRVLERSLPTALSPSTPLDGPTYRAAPLASRAHDEDEELDAPAKAAAEERLFREIRSRYQRLFYDRPQNVAELLADVEARLGELPELDAAELADVAADLAALALVVSRRAAGDE